MKQLILKVLNEFRWNDAKDQPDDPRDKPQYKFSVHEKSSGRLISTHNDYQSAVQSARDAIMNWGGGHYIRKHNSTKGTSMKVSEHWYDSTAGGDPIRNSYYVHPDIEF